MKRYPYTLENERVLKGRLNTKEVPFRLEPTQKSPIKTKVDRYPLIGIT